MKVSVFFPLNEVWEERDDGVRCSNPSFKLNFGVGGGTIASREQWAAIL